MEKESGGGGGGRVLQVVEDGEFAVDEDVDGADEIVEEGEAAGALQVEGGFLRGGGGGVGGRGGVGHGLMESWVGHLEVHSCGAAGRSQRRLRVQGWRCCWLDWVDASTTLFARGEDDAVGVLAH